MLDISSSTNILAWRRRLSAYSYRNAADLFAAEAAVLALLGHELAVARLLDIGIGTGRTTGHLAARCGSYAGVDYAPGMIERARARYPGRDLRVMDARDLGAFEPAAFDLVVFSYNGIDYVGHDDRMTVLAQVRRVLRPGGAFLFSAHRRGVTIPKASAAVNLPLDANPLRLARNVVKYVDGISNARRLKSHERHEADYALLNDQAQQYQLLTYYITPPAQQRQLESHGFAQVRAFAQTGRELDLAPGGAPPPADDYMVHYLARRT